MKDLRTKIESINQDIKKLVDEFLSSKGVVSLEDRFHADQLAFEFLSSSEYPHLSDLELLIEKRNEISLQIGKLKEKQKLDITDKEREELTISQFLEGVNSDLIPLYKIIINYIINLSKLTQYQALKKKKEFSGEIEVNADKSMVHRFLIFSSVAKGETVLRGNISGLDVYSTIKCLRQLGVEITIDDEKITINNPKAPSLTKPKEPLDAGNSGTTMRLLCGLLVGQSFDCEIIGDESLSKRPMDRVVEPLKLMGADIYCKDDLHPPIYINKNIYGYDEQRFDEDADVTSEESFQFDTDKEGKLLGLTTIEYNMPVASSQVKTAMMLADLYTGGRSKITEPSKTRDHSEILLKKMGYKLPLKSLGDVYVPGDISNAAYFIVGALLIPNANITIKKALINQSRIKYLEVLSDMNADINTVNITTGIEIFGDFVSQYSSLTGTTIDKDNVSSVIDEISILAVAAAFANGTTIIENPQELKHKESDRLTGLIDNLKKTGIKINLKNNQLIIKGNPKKKLSRKNIELDTQNDHRMAMTYTILALKSSSPIKISGLNSIFISNPDFLNQLSNFIK